MKYRAEIDGLRSCSIASYFFHAGFEYFHGGYLGVDIFCYKWISHNLNNICRIIQNKFSILKFYERRARRILPALFLVSFVTIPVSWNLLFPVQHKIFSKLSCGFFFYFKFFILEGVRLF